MLINFLLGSTIMPNKLYVNLLIFLFNFANKTFTIKLKTSLAP